MKTLSKAGVLAAIIAALLIYSLSNLHSTITERDDRRKVTFEVEFSNQPNVQVVWLIGPYNGHKVVTKSPWNNYGNPILVTRGSSISINIQSEPFVTKTATKSCKVNINGQIIGLVMKSGEADLTFYGVVR